MKRTGKRRKTATRGKGRGKSAASSPSTDAKRTRADRDTTTGRFLQLNRAARTHGISEFEKHGPDALPAHIRAEAETFVAAALSDMGGQSECSAIKLGLLRNLGRVDTIVLLLWDDIRQHGPLTSRGRMRNATTAFLQAIDRFDRIATRLGLQRHAKRVPDLETFIASRQAPQNGEEAK